MVPRRSFRNSIKPCQTCLGQGIDRRRPGLPVGQYPAQAAGRHILCRHLFQLADIFPAEFAARIKRVGVVNAMDDENFAAAVKATGRRKLIIAGVTNDVCTVYPALSLVSQGYEVQVVADAGGSPSKMADDIALRRMEKNGVTLTSTNQLIAELAGSWATPEGSRIVQEVIMGALQG
ncbi:isochorismatase [Cupriavidus sp. SK-4]|nr:isochorismatase [Cupriavidus sp. SK-4]